MKVFFVIVATLAFANSVLSTPTELTDQQDQLQAWANDLIQQGNDLRQEIQYQIWDTYVSNVEEHFADIATEFLNDVLVHQGRRGKAMAAELRSLMLAFRRELKYLMSYTRINEYMLKYFTDIIGPIIQEEYPIVAFQAAFEFDSAAAGACWTPVGDAVDAAIATFDTDVATLMGSVGDFLDYDLTSSLDDDVHTLWNQFEYYLYACASGETAEDDSKCILDVVCKVYQNHLKFQIILISNL